MNDKIIIGHRLRDLRRKNNLSQEELGKIIGITTSMIGMYETGARNPSFEVLTKLADYFNCTTDYLLGRTNDPDTKIIPKEELPIELVKAGLEGLEVYKTLTAKKLTQEDYKDILEVFARLNERHK